MDYIKITSQGKDSNTVNALMHSPFSILKGLCLHVNIRGKFWVAFSLDESPSQLKSATLIYMLEVGEHIIPPTNHSF